jgi:hypothetical protein
LLVARPLSDPRKKKVYTKKGRAKLSPGLPFLYPCIIGSQKNARTHTATSTGMSTANSISLKVFEHLSTIALWGPVSIWNKFFIPGILYLCGR